jgi:hypothetical protein
MDIDQEDIADFLDRVERVSVVGAHNRRDATLLAWR